MEIKDKLKNRRIDLGLTLKQVANATGVSEGTISRWETVPRHEPPSFETLLCVILTFAGSPRRGHYEAWRMVKTVYA